MRVGILGLLQESNTFLPQPTRWEHFAAEVLARGEEVREAFAASPHEIGGFFSGLEEEGIEAVPLFAARALPFGRVEAASFRRLVDTMFGELERCGKLDGLLVAPHGATVSEEEPDADGFWLSQVREMVGVDMPVVGTLDPHVNLSPKMVSACDALMAYRTNPHVDQLQRGIEAAQLIARMLKTGLRPTMAAEFPPQVISIECQCTQEPPCQDLFEMADRMLEQPEVLTNSVLLGFPYADVREMGSSVITVTDDDPGLARELCQRLAGEMWRQRKNLVGQPLDVQASIDLALQSKSPVCLLDMGDNVGGGSPADGTWIAHALFERGVENSIVVLNDPDCVQQAMVAGPGRKLALQIGGRSGPLNGTPLEASFSVKSMHDGKFFESQTTHGGYSSFDQGPTVVLTTDGGLTVVVTSRRMVPYSLGQLTSCDLDPGSFRVLVAKGVNAPIAAYQSVCPTFIRVNTDGCTSADVTKFEFHGRRRPMYPFERDTSWNVQ